MEPLEDYKLMGAKVLRFPTERALTAQLERLTSDTILFAWFDEDNHTAIAYMRSGRAFGYDTKRGWFLLS